MEVRYPYNIQPYHIVVGDKHRSSNRTTAGTELLCEVLHRYWSQNGKRPPFEEFLDVFGTEYHSRFARDFDLNQDVLHHHSGVNPPPEEQEMYFQYQDISEAYFRRATRKELEGFVKRGTIETVQDKLQQHRAYVDDLRNGPRYPEAVQAKIDGFHEILDFFEDQYHKLEQGDELAEILLNSRSPANMLREMRRLVQQAVLNSAPIDSAAHGAMETDDPLHFVEVHPVNDSDIDTIGDLMSHMTHVTLQDHPLLDDPKQIVHRRVQAYCDMYHSQNYQHDLNRLHTLKQDGYKRKPVDSWADDWAAALCSDDLARSLDKSRKVCLNLLYQMYDESHVGDDKVEDHMAVDVLKKQFNAEWVYNILEVGLPMDRSNALVYLRPITDSDFPRGIHWYSRHDVTRLQRLLQGYSGKPTMNSRYKWLVETFGLKSVFEELLKPVLQTKYIQVEYDATWDLPTLLRPRHER